MGCFGIFHLLRKKKSKSALPAPNNDHRIYATPNVPVQAYQSRGRTELYESSQFQMTRNGLDVPQIAHCASRRILIKTEPELKCPRLPRRASDDSSRSNVAKDERESSKTLVSQSVKPWLDLTSPELRREIESCRASHIDYDFLWRDRRDSLEEESILAARGQVSSQPRPRRSCKPDCLCPRCIARLFKEHKRPLINIQSQQDVPKPSRIPGPAASTRRESYSSSSSSRASSRNSSPDRTNREAYKLAVRNSKVPKVSDSESAKGEHQGRWNINRYSGGCDNSP
ncbi:uncharacterized protein F4807DRAFT_112339 [Annulohypoxylon truncatum]|uniref:uncharacterized protein n=1 Tax=Annulohypoxylon truncatum TaxID=327061 RepID=UPI002008E06C|nr:uncharacterized protein F4807DRAFT_112339 [Annulohypoxylon truncatum]KAI1214049.1 hypothetical protein F4807DRAFT_112339 [Annulohypoxylon truncatum]